MGLDSLNTPFLEKFVKENMADCQSGQHDIEVAELKNNPYMTEEQLTEQLNLYGDCSQERECPFMYNSVLTDS